MLGTLQGVSTAILKGHHPWDDQGHAPVGGPLAMAGDGVGVVTGYAGFRQREQPSAMSDTESMREAQLRNWQGGGEVTRWQPLDVFDERLQKPWLVRPVLKEPIAPSLH